MELVLYVLSQIQKKVIGNKTLPKTQLCTKYRKLLAVVKFEHYLQGRKFLRRTDHPSLKWLRNFKEPNVMIARWISVLDTYDFNI